MNDKDDTNFKKVVEVKTRRLVSLTNEQIRMHESVDFSGQPSEGSHNNDKSYSTIYKQLSRYV